MTQTVFLSTQIGKAAGRLLRQPILCGTAVAISETCGTLTEQEAESLKQTSGSTRSRLYGSAKNANSQDATEQSRNNYEIDVETKRKANATQMQESSK